jgi:precorrin-6A/cobalt-precorrin-6A reductase
MTKVLVLGGTTEAVDIARRLAALSPGAVIYSLAGRTRTPTLPDCAIRIGGFGGIDGLARFIVDEAVAVLIDATHPYAAQMTRHAAVAAERTGVALLKFLRPAWVKPAGASWIDADTAEDAARIVDGQFKRVFLSIGIKDLAAFSALSGSWFLIRTIEPPESWLPLPSCQLISGRGPFGFDDEVVLLRDHRIDALVTRNSGGAATEAKLHAAATLGIPVIMIARPPAPPGHCYDNIDHLTAALRQSLHPSATGCSPV